MEFRNETKKFKQAIHKKKVKVILVGRNITILLFMARDT